MHLEKGRKQHNVQYIFRADKDFINKIKIVNKNKF